MTDKETNSTNNENQESEQQPENQHLNLKVKSQDGNEVYFKVKKTTQLNKLMSAYCSRVGKELGTVRFLFDGERIQPEATPEQLDMEDEDEIDAMVEQHGGC
eukprot:UN27317